MESKAKIIVITVVSCAILLGVIACIVAIFYTRADSTPRLLFEPQPRDEDAGSSLIWYNQGNYEHTKHWIDSLTNSLEQYKEHLEYNYDYDVKDCWDENPAIVENGEVCKFDYQSLGTKCSEGDSWGYTHGTPCVILKMNKVLDWRPDVYTSSDIELDLLPKDMPEFLKERIRISAIDNGGEPARMIWVSCSGENPADEEWIGEIEYLDYTPWNGFPAYYFPYLNTPGYMSPMVAIRFKNLAQNVLVKVVCKAWAKNIKHSMEEPSGLVRFEILKD